MVIKELVARKFALFVQLEKSNLSFIDLLDKVDVDGVIFPSCEDIRRPKKKCLIGCQCSEGECSGGADFFIANLKESLKLDKDTEVLGKIGQDYDLDLLLNADSEIFKGVLADITAYPKKKFLTVGDLQAYISIALSSPVPVIVTTKKNIHPSEIRLLADADIKGIVLTKSVYGDTENTFVRAISAFKKEIDSLPEE